MLPAEVRARYPEFDAATYPDARVQVAIDDAGALIGSRWGTLAAQGQAALAAHYLATAQARIASTGGTTTTTVNGVGVATGAVKSMTVGDVSVTYETGGSSSTTTTRAANAQQQYGTTPYGLRYLELRAMLGPAVMVV